MSISNAMPPRESQPKFSEDPIVRRWNLFDAAANKPASWWFFSMLMLVLGTLGFFVWDFRGEVKDVRNMQMKYMSEDSRIMLQALQNNTAALDANTRTLQRMEPKHNNL